VQFGEILWWCLPNASGTALYDGHTTARFYNEHGRRSHTFLMTNDDPHFLRQTVNDHVDAIRSYALASHPNTSFELLWPLAVNDPATRRLNYYVNPSAEVGRGVSMPCESCAH